VERGQLGNLKSPNTKMIEIMVENSKKMRLILDSNVLEANGYLIRSLKKKFLDDTSFETQEMHKIAYLKIFLTYDGALLIRFSKLILENEIDRLRFYESGTWDKLIKQLVDEYDNSRQISFEDSPRLDRLRKFISNNRYNMETVRHLFPPRMGALCDFGIIEYEKPKRGGVIYKKKENTPSSTKIFVEQFPDFKILDKALSPKSGDFYERVAKMYQLDTEKIDIENDYEDLKNHIISAYNSAKIKNQDLVPLDAIEDSVCIRNLLGIDSSDTLEKNNNQKTSKKVCEIIDVRRVLTRMIKETKRFTTMVNRRGFPYYLREKI